MTLRVSFRGSDRVGWALDQEMRMTKEIVHWAKPSPIFVASVIHTVTWYALLGLPRILLLGRRVLSHLTHDPDHARELGGFDEAAKIVSLWIVRSRRAQERFDDFGLPSRLVPYAVDHRQFRQIEDRAEARRAFRQRYGIAADAYCIGSFQRDTEADCVSPKLVKGPDLFFDAVARAVALGVNVHVVLAGPRRMWLRDRLREAGIPYVWVGEAEADLVRGLPHGAMNELYNLIDLYLVSSRREGGPQAVLEAAAAQCKILSTRVGHAGDVLDPMCLYDTPEEAAAKIAADARDGALAPTVEIHLRSSQHHSFAALRPQWAEAYEDLMSRKPLQRRDVADRPGLVAFLRQRATRTIGMTQEGRRSNL